MSTSVVEIPQKQARQRSKAIVGAAVLVSFFDGNHKIHSAFAHILAVGAVDEETGQPALSLAFPNPNVDPLVFASPNWYKGYRRLTGVPHESAEDVTEGRASVAWGGEVVTTDDIKHEAPEIPQPEGDATRPYFKREVPREAPSPSPQQAVAVQQGKAPGPTTQSPLVNEPAGAVGDGAAAPMSEGEVVEGQGKAPDAATGDPAPAAPPVEPPPTPPAA